jgi:LysM repeat protein
MAAAKVARWLAPLAIAAVIAAIYLLAHRTLDKSHAPAHRATSTATHRITVPRTSSTARQPPRYYVVKSGDNLSSIALKTHVSLSTIENLNPNVNPAALQTGQRLRLR